MLTTLSKAASLSGKHNPPQRSIIPLPIGAYEHHAVSPSRHLPAPPPPRLTVRLLAMMMKLNYIRGTIPDLIMLTQHEVQYTITTLINNIYVGY